MTFLGAIMMSFIKSVRERGPPDPRTQPPGQQRGRTRRDRTVKKNSSSLYTITL
jgi:hypothetical protein